MLKMIKQKDIDKMGASDVTQEFVDYYGRLSEDRKIKLAKERPDLVDAIMVWKNHNPQDVSTLSTDIDQDNNGSTEETITPVSQQEKDSLDLSEVSHNAYEGIDLSQIVKDDFRPVEALVIDDSRTTCPAHRVELIRYNPRFHKPDGEILGMVFYYCSKCNRLFIKRSRYEANDLDLNEWKVPHKFFDYELSKRYLDSQTVPHVLSKGEKIYVPDLWIEEKPICPIHETDLETLQCICNYRAKQIDFKAWYCEQCKKVLLRRTSALNLEDKCAAKGIPLIEYEPLAKRMPKKTAVPKREINADYLMDNGIRTKNSFGSIADCYRLAEDDTVVVSDSAYCGLDGHDTQTVIGQIWVTERSGGRKSYLFMLGYCAECQKYYMDEVDYKAIYDIGRPEITVLIDTGDDDNSYMISSGEVFDIEKTHLKKLEDTISSEINDIQHQTDYVNPYATLSYYDEGGLAFDKAISKKKYESRLGELHGYTDRPYQYRVDICEKDKTEIYYIGASDIDLGGRRAVISANSKFGRELLNYKTIKVKKGRKEYSIKLSRQFDIIKASLFGYANLRTDEDIIFRRGITDPFLVRVLNMRKRQHNLIDIFVTIQENQNRIVDALFEKSLIVQGCAGSGKTMVLLHRLSSLKYNRPDFNFSNDALIITPNEHFSLHIKGLAESLQVGSIERLSVEKYYSEVLATYSSELKPTGSIASEMLVNQAFVDYIYSDDFKRQFNQKYSMVLEDLYRFVEVVQSLLAEANEKPVVADRSQSFMILPKLKTAIDNLTDRINSKILRIQNAKKQLDDLITRKETLSSKTIPRQITATTTIINDSVAAANTKVLPVLKEIQERISEKRNSAQQLTTEREKLLSDTQKLKEANCVEELDSIVQVYQALIDETLVPLIERVRETRNEISRNEDAQGLLNTILACSIDEIVSGKDIQDSEITSLQKSLAEAKDTISKYEDEIRRIEASWVVFGKQRRITTIQAQIEDVRKTMNSIKDRIHTAYENRESEFRNLQKENAMLKDRLYDDAKFIVDRIIRKIRSKVYATNTKISVLELEIADDEKRLKKLTELVDKQHAIVMEDETIAWLDALSEEVPAVKDEYRLCKRMQGEVSVLQKTCGELSDRIAEAEQQYREALDNQYTDSIINQRDSIRNELDKYTALNLFRRVFELTVRDAIEQNRITTIIGKWHRYDLYALLCFAIKFYGIPARRYKFICIDEGQDLAINEYRIITELNNPGVVYNIFGDTNQLIKPGRGINDWDSLKKEIAADEYILNENYRNTNQITRFCNDSFDMNMLQTGVDGAKVREITQQEFDEELFNQHLETERVAILIPRSISKKKLFESVLVNQDIKERIGEDIGNGKIALMYVDEVKGIEFDKVFVFVNGMGRNEKYIAYSRALSELIIVVDNNISQ